MELTKSYASQVEKAYSKSLNRLFLIRVVSEEAQSSSGTQASHFFNWNNKGHISSKSPKKSDDESGKQLLQNNTSSSWIF